MDLAKRYDIDRENYPEYRLFMKDTDNPIAYTGDENNAEDIKRFIVKNTGNNFKTSISCKFSRFYMTVNSFDTVNIYLESIYIYTLLHILEI